MKSDTWEGPVNSFSTCWTLIWLVDMFGQAIATVEVPAYQKDSVDVVPHFLTDLTMIVSSPNQIDWLQLLHVDVLGQLQLHVSIYDNYLASIFRNYLTIVTCIRYLVVLRVFSLLFFHTGVRLTLHLTWSNDHLLVQALAYALDLNLLLEQLCLLK